jgi:hypothetical protein
LEAENPFGLVFSRLVKFRWNYKKALASSKGQLISKRNFCVFKKANEFFLKISALASKMGQIKKIKSLYHIR